MSEDPARAYYRILDAAANRAGEGLRTLEEYARFGLDDANLTEQLKRLRHGLTATLAPIARERLLNARDTPGDVGTAITLSSERQRESAEDVVAAAAARTQQSLRCLEEYSKTIDPNIAVQIEQLRYRSYSLMATLELQQIVHSRRERIGGASIYVLIDAGPSVDQLAATVRSLDDAGIDVLQLRDPNIDDRTLYDRACAVSKLLDHSSTIFIVNDRPDIAAAAEADGVHVGQEEIPVAAARRIVGGHRLVGVSTHSISQARDAVADGADYIGCGPVFPGRTKAFDSYVGPALLKQVAGEIDLPAFAIGGIDTSNVAKVADAGFTRIAVTGAIRDAENPAKVIAQLRTHLER
tara:strand:+ start:70478 stop:71533 length:1056 start_codon:yes stop_codon:yes gene_type:complete